MLSNILKQSIEYNMWAYAEVFRKTKKIDYLIRYAQEGLLLQQDATNTPANKSWFSPVSIKEFLDFIKKASLIQTEDAIQNHLAALMGAALGLYFSELDANLPAFKTNEFIGPQANLTSSLVPKDQSKLKILFLNAIKKSRLPKNIVEKILHVYKNEDLFNDALWYVLTLAYSLAWQYNLIKNPILLVIPSQYVDKSLKKEAASPQWKKMTPEFRGPRLSDLILMLEIAHGKYGSELCRLETDIKKLESTGVSLRASGLERARTELRHLVMMLDAYIIYLKDMREALVAFMKENPKHPYIRWGDGAQDYVTDDPLIKAKAPEVKYLNDLFRAPPSKDRDVLRFKVRTWAGHEVAFGNFALDITSMLDEHIGYKIDLRLKSGQSNILTDIHNNASKFVAFNQANAEEMLARIHDLRNLLPGLDEADITDQTIVEIREALRKAIPVIGADVESQMLATPDQINSDERMGIRHADKIAEYEKARRANIDAALNSLVAKYNNVLRLDKDGRPDKTSFIKFCNKILHNDIQPFSPGDIRNFSLQAPAFEFAKKKEYQNHASKVIREHLEQMFESPGFQLKFITNEADINEYNEEHKNGAPSTFETKVGEGAKKLETDAYKHILVELGISTPSKLDAKEFSAQFDTMIQNALLQQPSNMIQDKLGEIPMDAVYAYIYNQFMIGMQRRIICSIACRFGGAVEPREFKESPGEVGESDKTKQPVRGYEDCKCKSGEYPSKTALDEALEFINGRFSKITEGFQRHVGKLGTLKIDTGPGIVKEWHNNPKLWDLKGKPNFSAVFIDRATRAFGAYLRDRTREPIDELFEINKLKRSRGDKFDGKTNPTNYYELAHVVGAFANPDPSLERIEKDVSLYNPLADSTDVQDSGKYDSAINHMHRIIFSSFPLGQGSVDVIQHLKMAFLNRKHKILSIRPDLKDAIVPFDITKTRREEILTEKDGYVSKEVRTIYVTNNPFASGYINEAVPPKTEEKEVLAPHITSAKDALYFIANLPDSMINSAAKDVVRDYINSVPKDQAVYVFNSNETFWYTLIKLFDDLKKYGTNVEYILDLLVPGKALPAVIREQSQPPKIDINLAQNVRRQMIALTDDMMKILDAPIPTSEQELNDEIDGIRGMLAKVADIDKAAQSFTPEMAAILKVPKNKLIEAVRALEMALTKRQNALAEFEAIRSKPEGSSKLESTIFSILDIFSNAEIEVIKSGPGGMLKLPAQVVGNTIAPYLKSLIGLSEDPEDVIHPEMVEQATMAFDRFLSILKANKRIDYRVIQAFIQGEKGKPETGINQFRKKYYHFHFIG